MSRVSIFRALPACSRSGLAAGVRGWIVPDRVQVDSTYGWQLNGTHRTEWITFGLRLITKPLL